MHISYQCVCVLHYEKGLWFIEAEIVCERLDQSTQNNDCSSKTCIVIILWSWKLKIKVLNYQRVWSYGVTWLFKIWKEFDSEPESNGYFLAIGEKEIPF